MDNYDYSFVKKEKGYKTNEFTSYIKELGLHGKLSSEKFIPDIYKFSSIDDRIELLRGLMDSDGSIGTNGVVPYLSTTSSQLKDDFIFLIQSLGGVAKYTIKKTGYKKNGVKIICKPAYSIRIKLKNINPFKLPRKFEKFKPLTKYFPCRFITNIKFAKKDLCQCILVDSPDHLYLTDNCIVTHNTHLAVLCGLKQISGTKDGMSGKYSELIYIRSAVESSDSKIGYLPGGEDDKMGPYLVPLKEKLAEFLPNSDIQLLEKDQRIVSVPLGFVRGLNWNAKFIIADEVQNMSKKEIITLITRVGEFSKIIVLGDPYQSDIGTKSGFTTVYNMFNDDESKQNGIYTFEFTDEDIVRSELVKFIMKRIKEKSIDSSDYVPSQDKKLLKG